MKFTTVLTEPPELPELMELVSSSGMIFLLWGTFGVVPVSREVKSSSAGGAVAALELPELVVAKLTRWATLSNFCPRLDLKVA